MERGKVNTDLVHTPRNRPALHQRVITIRFKRCEIGLRRLAIATVDLHHTIVQLENRLVNKRIAKVVNAVGHRVVDLGNLPVLELEAHMAIRFEVLGYGKNTGGIFIEPVAHLGGGHILAGKAQYVYLHVAIFQRGDKRWLIDPE